MKTSVLVALRKAFVLITAICLNLIPSAFATLQVAPLSITAAAPRQVALSFKDIGAYKPIILKGVDGSAYLSMGVRLDEVVTKASLHLDYRLSPALLPGLSHINVYLNDEIVATFPVTRESLAGPQKVDLDLDPRFFTDFNKIRLQLIGHYSNECELPFHTSLWAEISNTSKLEMSFQPVSLLNDLALLPAPFFDKRDNRQLELPFVFAAHPTLSSLRAAGGLASWFGALASYRGAHFPALLNRLPARYGIVFATNDERPDFLVSYPKVNEPTISLMSNPADPTGKLLLILGRNAADLQLAADALSLGKALMSGRSIAVKTLAYPPRRAAYDAPNWLQAGHPIPFGQLVDSPSDLERWGQHLEPIRINARLPADLFTWEAKGVPIDLKYRYTPPSEQGDAHLSVEINEQFIESMNLLPNSGTGGKNRLLLPILDDGSMREQSKVEIPAFQLGSNNQLTFSFAIPPSDNGRCKSSPQADMQAAIDPDSTLDLSHFYHYAAMPNLAFFANSGFPFTKYADLAETTIVIPDQPDTADIDAMLALLGQMGRSTGIAALRFKLIQPVSIQQARDTDLLVISSGADKDSLLAGWGKSLPALLKADSRSFTLLGKVINYDWFGMNGNKLVKPDGNTVLQGTGPLSAITAFESPLTPLRSVVAVTANVPDALMTAVDAMSDSGKVQYIRGDLALMSADKVESYRVNDAYYYIGHLPWWRWVWFHLHQHPLLLTVIGIMIGLFVALLAFGALRALAARRLSQNK